MSLGPPVCVPCMCIMDIIDPYNSPDETHTQGWPSWRCSICGHLACKDPKRTADYETFPERTHFVHEWCPAVGELAIVQTGAKVSRSDPLARIAYDYLTEPLLVTLAFVLRTRVGWFDDQGVRRFTTPWEVLPAPSPVELLAQSQDEGRA
jgi:hypothetical protein